MDKRIQSFIDQNFTESKSDQRYREIPLILLTGNPKTGTTALFYSIKNALPQNSVCIFEPENSGARLPEKITVPVLVKCFMGLAQEYDHFNKKILITRDPRDQIISQMLYTPYNLITRKLITPEDKLERALDRAVQLLLQKEKNPAGVTIQEIRELMLLDIGISPQEKLIDYHYHHPDIMVFRYEDYVDGNFDRLNKYLGLKIEKTDDVAEKRVIRSKSYGFWKDWFTPSDVDHYKARFGSYMKLFGYEDNWKINPLQTIDPSVSSHYVRNLIDEAKDSLKS